MIKYRTRKPNEYFLVENRSKMGLDRALPASGLAVYHCDILGSNELQQGTATKHYQCALLQADGRRDLELNVNQGDGADLFGAIGGIALSAESSPHSREWDGRDSGLVIADISRPGADDHVQRRAGARRRRPWSPRRRRRWLAIPDNVTAGLRSTIAIADPARSVADQGAASTSSTPTSAICGSR